MAVGISRQDVSGLPDPCGVEELARAVRMSKNTIHLEIRAGRLGAKRLGKTIRIRRSAVDDWLRR